MTERIPGRLAAPAAGWTVRADVVVVGSGVAGLCAALHARRAGRVLLVTKAALDAGSTRWAQGGIAAAVGPPDSPEQHEADTLTAGVGLCDRAAVSVLVNEGPDRLRQLIRWGARFDLAADGTLALTREGGHGLRRVVHAGGDATGAEVSRALVAAVREAPEIEVVEQALVLDLLRDPHGAAAGVTLHVLGAGRRDGVGAALGRAVVLATGGLGQVYAATTNPSVSTGDGVALALRAGAEIADLEFVQFHPTALWVGPRTSGQQPLVSEAMRGEGAVLVDRDGRRVMPGVHPLADLAPRDVVSKQMSRVMAATGVDHLFLDARPIGRAELGRRFPGILARCRAAGVDPVTDPIPVAPAAHYASGGVRTDLSGRTSLPGLYACGEVACTGVHGANRLASNSLLEGLVYAGRIGAALARDLPPRSDPIPAGGPQVPPLPAATRGDVARSMTDGAGVLRSAASLASVAKTLQAAAERAGDPEPATWEATNVHAVATAIVFAANARRETRGCHWREDFPSTDPGWCRRLLIRRTPDGTLTTRTEAV